MPNVLTGTSPVVRPPPHPVRPLPHTCSSPPTTARCRRVQRDDDVTIVTQLSPDRFDRVQLLAKRYDGPISAAVYVRRVTQELTSLVQQWKWVARPRVPGTGGSRTHPGTHPLPSPPVRRRVPRPASARPCTWCLPATRTRRRRRSEITR